MILSQKLSQLSTENENKLASTSVLGKRQRPVNISMNANVKVKKIKMEVSDTDTGDDNDTDQDGIPIYLLETNKLFKNMCQTLIKSKPSITLHDIQHVALIMHEIGVLTIKKQITSVYLQSILGELKQSQYDFKGVDRRVWPIQVISLMLTHQKLFITNAKHEKKTEIDIETKQRVSEELLQQQLKEIDIEVNHLQKELDNQKKSLVGLTLTMEDMIQNYVQQYGLKLLQIKNDFNIAILKHNYDAEILQRQCFKENPNDYQVSHNMYVLKIVSFSILD